jgi:hypothetical protein
MKLIYLLFVLFFLLQYTTELKAQEILYPSEDLLHNKELDSRQSSDLLVQEISFYYDKIVGSHLNQSDENYLLENLTREIWNESSSDWVNDSLYEYSYNSHDFVDTLIAHKWRYGTTWGNEFKITYNYNAN